MKAGQVNLDSASGLPLLPAARDVLAQALDQGWSDPLRLHREGRAARLLLDNAREVIASVLKCRVDEVGFVSSGTTACHAAVLGLRRGRSRTGEVVVHSAVEHSAVLHAARWDHGQARAVRVDQDGRLDVADFADAVAAPGVAMACVQAANHEVGVTQPLDQAHDACLLFDVPLLVDAAAAIGWVPSPERWDVLAGSAHKWGGPAGVGVLAIRKGTRWRSPWPGDERERVQAGFANVPAVLAAAAALQVVERERVGVADRLRGLTADLRREVASKIPDVELAGHASDRVPHIVNFSCLYVDGEALVTELDRAGFAVSSGSACTSSALEPSHVLVAMGVLTHGNVRVSLTPDTTSADLARFVETTAAIVSRLRTSAGIPR